MFCVHSVVSVQWQPSPVGSTTSVVVGKGVISITVLSLRIYDDLAEGILGREKCVRVVPHLCQT